MTPTEAPPRDEVAGRAPDRQHRDGAGWSRDRLAFHVGAEDELDQVLERQRVGESLEQAGERVGRPNAPERKAIGSRITFTTAETFPERMSPATRLPAREGRRAEPSASRNETAGRGGPRRKRADAERDQDERLQREDDEDGREHSREEDGGGSGVERSRFRIPYSRRTTSVIASPANAVLAAP